MNTPNRGLSIPTLATFFAAGMLLYLGTRGESHANTVAGAFPSRAYPVSLNSHSAAFATTGCGNCHEIDPAFSHPLGVAPPAGAPAELELDRGLMTCATCHDTSGPEGHELAMTIGDPMLRLPARDLCLSCHAESDFGSSGAHGGIATKAHTNWPADSRNVRGSGSLSDLDLFSQECLSCHDGMIATDPDGHSRPTLSQTMFTDGHPVGVDYPETNRDAHWLRLHDRHRLDPRVRLFDGAVGCGSCHSVYSQNDNLLVIDNDGSDLCFACHAL